MTKRKFWDIDQPPVVVLAGDAERCHTLERRLQSATDYRVESVVDSERALVRLEQRPRVECLWIAVDHPEEADLDLLRRVSERAPGASLVLAPAAGDEGLAGRATAAGATEYVPGSASLDDRVERIERAVERGIDRHHDAEKRSVLDSLLEALDASLYVKDERARHLLVSQGSGLDPERVYGKTDPEVYEGVEEIQESYLDDLRVIETGDSMDWSVERFVESDTWMRSTKVPWSDGERTRGLVGLTTSVTDLKRSERDLIRKVGQLQQIPDYVAHDIRNPLSVAKGYLELARDGDESALEEIERSLDRMAELLDDFHSLATQEIGSGDTLEQVRIRALIEDVWRYVETDESTLELDVPSETYLLADESHLRPMLKNLLGNAVTHAGPDATVRVGLLEDGFYVADDGPGVPEDERDVVFDRGFTTAEEGTGIGLAIVREAAHTHRWTVSVTDGDRVADGPDDGGACFRIEGCLIGTPSNSTPAGTAYELTESVDVGDVDVPGRAVGSDGTYTVTGAGRNIWMQINEFHFLHATVEGAVRIQARIADLDAVSEWSKAGVMVRSGLEETAAYSYVGLVADRCPELAWRTDPGASGTSRPLERLPDSYEWVRIDRIGADVYVSLSVDGERWQLVDQRPISLGEPVVVGLVACSVAPGETIDARFEDVSVVDLSEE